MPTHPDEPGHTFTGLAALQMLAMGNNLLDALQRGIDSGGGGGILKTVNNWAIGIVRNVFNSVVDFLAPSAPGYFPYLQTDPSWMETLALSTANTFSVHRSHISWLRSSLIPWYYNQSLLAISALRADENGAIARLQSNLQKQLGTTFNQLHQYTTDVYNTLLRDINNAEQSAIDWTNKTETALNAEILSVYSQVLKDINNAYSLAVTYTDKQISAVNSKLTAVSLSLTAAIAASAAFITTQVVPDAVEAGVAALNAEAAASMDIGWEYVATVANRAMAAMTVADTNPLWLTDLLSEIPATSLAAADADLVSGLKLLVDWVAHAGTPLYSNLKSFGEDTAELDGVLTTVLLGAFGVAAVTEPGPTATAVVDVLADPLNEVLTAAAGLFGLA